MQKEEEFLSRVHAKVCGFGAVKLLEIQLWKHLTIIGAVAGKMNIP